MTEISSLKVGDDIYNLDSSAKVGVIHSLYRYQATQNKLYDTEPYCDYEYQTGPNTRDNTSRQGGAIYFGSKEEAEARLQLKLRSIK